MVNCEAIINSLKFAKPLPLQYIDCMHHNIKSLHNMASIVSPSRAGKDPFLPRTVLERSSSVVNNSSISNLRTRVGWRFDFLNIAANEELLMRIPMFFTNSIFCTGIYYIN